MHVGLHKTGTTSLQVGMRKLAPQLRANGVGVLTLPQIKALPAQKAWMAWGKPHRTKAPLFRRQLHQLIAEEAVAVAVASGAPMAQLLFSEERSLGVRMPSQVDNDLFRPRAQQALGELLDIVDAEVSDVIIYVRRQDTFMESAYLWEIQKGLSHSIHEQFPFSGKPIIDYWELMQRIEVLERVNSLWVRPFELIGAGSVPFLDHFLKAVQLDGKLDYTPLETGYSANRSYSQKALDIALKMNSEIDTSQQAEAVKRFLKKRFGVDKYPRAFIWSDADRQAIVDVYRPSNEKLFGQYMSDLPQDAYTSLGATGKLGKLLRKV